MVDRICVGPARAVTGLDDDAAADLLGHVDAVHAAVALLDEGAGQARTPAPAPDEDGGQAGTDVVRGTTPRGRWLVTLRGICDRQDLHGLIEGRLTRILLDAGELDDAGDRGCRGRCRRGQTPARAAAWIEGFLAGGGLLLVHDDRLLGLVDDWLTGLARRPFIEVLPLLRRTFGASPRRSAGRSASASASAPGAAARSAVEDGSGRAARGGRAVRTVLAILGKAESADG